MNRILGNLDVLAEAAGGVKELRRLVLKLGLAGRLGTNDSRDTAPDLNGPPGELKDVAPPHANWRVCRLSDVAEIEMGNSPPGSSYNDEGRGVPLVNGPVEFSPGPFGRTRRTKSTTAPTKMCRRGDLLVCVRGATTGRTNIADFDACIGRGVALVRAHMFQGFINYFMWSVGADLLAVGTGTTFPAISREDLVDLVVPLAPIPEQKRIVAKVDQLMALCGELEAKQTKKREVGDRLTKAALGALTLAETPEALATAWKRAAGNFERLTSTPPSVGSLREAILGLALGGRLGSSQAVLPHDVRSDRLHAGAWATASVGELADCVLGKMLDQAKHRSGTRRPYLRNINVRWNAVDLSDLKEMFFEEDEHDRYGVRLGDVLICEGGEPGRAAVWTASDSALIQKAIHRVRPGPRLVPEWLVINLRYDSWTRRLDGHFTGATIKHFTGKALAGYRIPVPPVAEQRRILERVKMLMKLCDDLEAKLRTRDETAARLAEALVVDAVAG